MTTTARRSTMKTPAWLAMPGAGTCLGVVAGAVEALSERFSWLGYAGTSGGGLCAAAYAFGMAPADVSTMIRGFVTRTDLLDTGLPFIQGGDGLFRGKNIEKILRDTFGEKTKMGDVKHPLRLCVSSMWTRKAAIVDSVRHADVLLWRAARATMSIQGVFDTVRLREDNARTYGDGGAGLNVPAGAWDDMLDPTVSLRFKAQQPMHSLGALMLAADGGADYEDVQPVRDHAAVIGATFEILMGASCSAIPSSKVRADFLEVVLDTDADSLQFGITPTEADRRRLHGSLSAKRALATLAREG